jgi:hypothetical protein
MMRLRVSIRPALALLAAVGVVGCAGSLRSPHIADLRDNPARYQQHSVNIDGIVTTSWSLPLVPYSLYKVDDGTGEMTVVGRGMRTPTRGARVRVRGRVDDLGVVGGQAIGLHLQEQDLRLRR